MLRHIVWIAVVWNVGCASMSAPGLSRLENSLVYQPSNSESDDWAPANLLKEDAWFETEDGLKLHGWYCPAPNPRVVVLYAHGNGGNITHRADQFRMLTNRLGATVLGFDYRGYGKSEGTPSEQGLVADARAARKFLAEKAGVPEADIVLLGQSLGGAVVVQLAAHDGARALVLQSTFTSLADVANYKFPLTPPGKVRKNKFDSLSIIDQYQGPVLIAHGTADKMIPFAHAEALYAAAGGAKSFLAVKDKGHNWKPTLEYAMTLDEFFSKL